MTILGNLCLALALFLYAVPLQFLLHDPSSRRSDGGFLPGIIFVFLPFWILLAIALCAVTARGGLDWVWRDHRGSQYALVIAACIALSLVSFFSAVGKYEPASQVPWAARLFSSWALLVFPLIALAFAFLSLNPSVGATVPPLVYRLPMTLIAGLSLLVAAGLLGQWFISSQQRQMARVDRIVEEGNERDRNIMERVQSLNPTNDFRELLGFANRFEKESIRKVAIDKAQSNPDFFADLAKVLQDGSAERGMIYLDGCDVSAADQKTLAEPVRVAIGTLTQSVKEAIADNDNPYPERFDWNTRLILSVTEKFQNTGVDYLPAIRDYRAALETTKVAKNFYNAPRTLDQWLAKQAKNKPAH